MLTCWLSVLAFVVYLAGAKECPDDSWEKYNDEHCIKVYEERMSWEEARKTCQTEGSDLVQIEDSELNEFVRALLPVKKDRYWIGISDHEKSGLLLSVSGKRLDSYTNWRKREPKMRPNIKNCVEIIANRHGRWKVKPCFRKRGFVCQKGAVQMKKWDDLKVTWGKPGVPGFFNSMPRTSQDALDQGFTKISDCDVHGKWRGSRYVKNDDYLLVLLYDVNGYIAGVQNMVTSEIEQETGYPTSQMKPPFVRDDEGNFVLSVYFVDPGMICTTGRNSTTFESQGTGTHLYIQNGNDPETDIISIPRVETGLVGTKWFKGQCFPTMGQHYWYDASEDMDCDNTFPVFLIYNGGQLNVFGWFMLIDIQSKLAEHPPKLIYNKFIKPVPKCFYDYERLTTLHIYLTSNIMANRC